MWWIFLGFVLSSDIMLIDLCHDLGVFMFHVFSFGLMKALNGRCVAPLREHVVDLCDLDTDFSDPCQIHSCSFYNAYLSDFRPTEMCY